MILPKNQVSACKTHTIYAGLRRIIYRHAVCVPQALLRWRSSVLGEESFTCGKIVFHGPNSFLILAREAIGIVRKSDKDFAEELCKLDVKILYLPKVTSCFGNYFSIGNAYLNWGVDGLLVHILFVYFGFKSHGEEFFQYPSTKRDQAIYDEILAWLKQRNLPTKLAQDLAEEK